MEKKTQADQTAVLSPEIDENFDPVDGRKDYSQKEREAMDKSDFGDPENLAFPIKVASDVIHAAERLHNSKGDQDAIKRRIIAIAHRKGFPLPDTWTEKKEGDEKRAAAPDNHPPFAGPHTHSHSHNGGEYEPDHEHTHDGDQAHDHTHPAAQSDPNGDEKRSLVPQALDGLLYAPIKRIDEDKREVTVVATAERFDSYGTVIGFEGSQEAFSKWGGNIREMHDPTKAVGRALQWKPIPQTKEIECTLRVSPGAEDTWQKVLDGTLCGASIGARNGKWSKRNWDGKDVPFLERYDLVELSLVDNPACPGCEVKLVRADGMATDVIDFSQPEPAPTTPAVVDQTVERAGATLSKPNREKLHAARDSMIGMCADSGCPECKAMMTATHDDGDGDMDLPGGVGDVQGMPRFIEAAITRHLAPYMARAQAVLSQHARVQPAEPVLLSTEPTLTRQEVEADIQRHIATLEATMKTELDKVSALAGEIKDLAVRIAEQPAAGGPMANTLPVDKRFAGSPDRRSTPFDDIAAIQRASELGVFPDQQSQLNAAARIIALQRQMTPAQ